MSDPGDDTAVYELYLGNRASALLAVAVRLGLFAALADRPLTTAQIGERWELSPRGADALVTGLVSLGLLHGRDDGFHLTERAFASLVPGGPGYLGGLIDLELENFMSPQMLLTAMRTGRHRVYGGDDIWERHAVDPEQARRFTMGMHAISLHPARALAQSGLLAGRRHLLDVGGGSGVYAVAAMRAHPELHATVFDIGPVCDIAGQHIADAGLAERGSTCAGDMFVDPFPGEPDAILFAQIMHDWPVEVGQRLLSRAFDALPPGGRVVISEKLLDDDRRGPAANAMVSLDMLIWTEGQQYTGRQLCEMLAAAGFVDAGVRRLCGFWSAVSAVRP